MVVDTTITLLIPTYNEAENIAAVLRMTRLWGCPIIVVDDNSPDGTADMARAILDGRPQHKVLVRKDARGLGSAIRDAAKLATTPWVAVMDSDWQHDPYDLLRLIDMRDSDVADVYSGSRLMGGGRVVGLPGWRKVATKILNFIGGLRAQTKATDYLTGMFVARRDLVTNTHEEGFKLLYDILKNNKVALIEQPITLRERNAGESKASFAEITRYLKLVFS